MMEDADQLLETGTRSVPAGFEAASRWRATTRCSVVGAILFLSACVSLLFMTTQERSDSAGSSNEIINLDTVNVTSTTLYCWSAMLPWGNERDLLEAAAEAKQGIFGCDGYAIWSSTNGTVGNTSISTLKDLQMGVPIQWGTRWRINTPVFETLWKHVYKEGSWKKFDWTLKVDPDTFFIADRLRGTLAWHSEDGAWACGGERGCYLKNCPAYSQLYGAAEILSRNAMSTFGSTMKNCWYSPREDKWLDDCLWHLGVHPRAESAAFCLRGCPCDAVFYQCSGGHAVWHALGQTESWKNCLRAQSD
mmetsp:Transcript_7798/g.13849  ORF Transcript_7798/g.13849 Transcript_7798/m.13849 type:complete len:305 (-) Transcript_7798:39-953(-)|eukprot:CAMPEP_0197632352 /NCGR_PEP_ID=MMETSP1338-20131121/9145_1 /TAXON_ID=43686 ORGANISM="Pelagodinium beii, Strain RCC1491" /NCGR_SAMPLE_ID=MMETSP1338 /ASSEMBLY_ACC=CAM_ASM_000754 /LENGTH=304 /DNA_ID=CAMNT_0043203915 /DNA_START=83 /DNA_END=997 /DNA_ORIENTATION=-